MVCRRDGAPCRGARAAASACRTRGPRSCARPSGPAARPRRPPSAPCCPACAAAGRAPPPCHRPGVAARTAANTAANATANTALQASRRCKARCQAEQRGGREPARREGALQLGVAAVGRRRRRRWRREGVQPVADVHKVAHRRPVAACGTAAQVTQDTRLRLTAYLPPTLPALLAFKRKLAQFRCLHSKRLTTPAPAQSD